MLQLKKIVPPQKRKNKKTPSRPYLPTGVFKAFQRDFVYLFQLVIIKPGCKPCYTVNLVSFIYCTAMRYWGNQWHMLSHHHQVMKPKLMQIPLFYLIFIADMLLAPIQLQNRFKFQFCRWHWWHVFGVGHLAVARSSIVTRWTWNDMKLVQSVLPSLWQWQCMWALPAGFMPKVYYLLVCFRVVLMIILIIRSTSPGTYNIC